MKIIEESAESVNGYKSVAEFYAGKSVFITGGTGFLGKVLIEKLLFSCKDIENIFILIREKKGVNAKERLQQIINQPLFSRLKSVRPQDLNKIVPIIGDINEADFGISSVDENKLIEKVSVVFHVAATVKFNEKLDVAVEINVKGTQYALNLCHRMKHIKAFVHVSTAYCNTDQPVLEEKVYPPKADFVEVLKFVQQPYRDDKKLEKKFLRGAPNTYTFTKGLAENYVSDHRGNVPTVIIRPSTVSPSLREPLKGWTDTWFGATGLVTASVKGANRVLFGDPKYALDIIPVDYVINSTIVAAAECSSFEELEHPHTKEVVVSFEPRTQADEDMKIIEESAESVNGYKSVAEFYAGKSIFITGGTGFLGKVLIEKLLFSCKDIENIFILIREKKGVNVKERVQQIINQPLFSRLKSVRPQDLNKIVPIIGDINEADFGISSADENNLIEKVTDALRGAPNTYTFTKGLAENYVSDHRENVPTVIIRPSTVSPSLREPLKGWTDTWFGATGLVTASVKGANRVLLCDPKYALDIIPVDYVINCTIVAAAECSSSNALTVYNACTSSCNPISIKGFIDGIRKSAVEIGFHDNSFPLMLYTNCEWALIFFTFLLQTIPAYLGDLFRWASGKRPKYVKLQSKVIYGRNVLNYFTSHSWEMKANNVKNLYASLSHTDKIMFPCDPSDLNWKEYLSIFVKGIQKYLKM